MFPLPTGLYSTLLPHFGHHGMKEAEFFLASYFTRIDTRSNLRAVQELFP